jgi:outer membrane protein
MIGKIGIAAALLVAVVGSQGSIVLAADIPAAMPVKAPPVAAWNPWMIRLRALVVDPRDATTFDQLPGGNAHWSTSVVPELDITYFFTPNIAAELILGVTPHRATGKGIVTGGAAPGLNMDGLPIGKTWLLPPTLTLQYHFTNFGAFKPYIGAGVNYTVFFSEKAANTPGGSPSVRITSLDVHNAFAPALQAGFDYMIDRHWGINVDVKKLFLRPNFDASVNNGAIPLTGKAKLDPWLIGAGLTYKF